uniref:Ig-like domain-containing protein n=1 Tax=Terrapene triunguis TaxID=2587831 RepID=A0A674JY55_9SAUR
MTPFLLGLGGCPGLALTACLLCADPSLPRPSISLSPTGITAPGADVTIRCQGQRRNVTFFLHKAGDLNPQQHMDPAGDGAEFLIPTVGRQHGGSYSCSYRSEPFAMSYPSDPVELVLRGEGYPKPSISLRPSGEVALGGAVTVRCWGRHQNMRFLLYKDGNPNVLDAGSYSCYHHDKVYQFIWSHPSDPVELGVSNPALCREPAPGRSAQLTHSLAGRLLPSSPHCLWLGRRPGKAQDGEVGGRDFQPVPTLTLQAPQQPPRQGLITLFVPLAGFSPGGPRLWNCAARTGRSDCAGVCLKVCLLLTAETTYSKPSISLHPSREVTPGEAVTVRCQAQYQNMRFLLYKDGNPTAVQEVEPAGNMAEFPIRNVSRRDAGSYRCRYSNKTDPPASSHPSDPVELVVAERDPVAELCHRRGQAGSCQGESPIEKGQRWQEQEEADRGKTEA